MISARIIFCCVTISTLASTAVSQVLLRAAKKPQSIFIRGEVKSYCDIKCGEEPHTLCNPKQPDQEKCEKNFMEYPTTGLFQQIMLDGHNGIRNRIARSMKVSNMNMLTWNCELANMAKFWLRRCDPFTRDPCALLYQGEHVDEEEEGVHIFVNQNMATKFSRYYPLNFPDVTIRTWYMEKNRMHPPRIEQGEAEIWRGYFNVSNNFTQLATAISTSVGCAMSRSGYLYTIACNYYPYDGHTHAFLRGTPSSECPNRYPLADLKYTMLCTNRGGMKVGQSLVLILLINFITSIIYCSILK